jgi:hypothetical protein
MLSLNWDKHVLDLHPHVFLYNMSSFMWIVTKWTLKAFPTFNLNFPLMRRRSSSHDWYWNPRLIIEIAHQKWVFTLKKKFFNFANLTHISRPHPMFSRVFVDIDDCWHCAICEIWHHSLNHSQNSLNNIKQEKKEKKLY